MVAAVLGSTAPVALASCVEIPETEEGIRRATTVFVGQVIETDNLRRWVLVDVEDVWKGEVADRVEVHAGPPDPPGPMQVASSGDRHYKLDKTYLFVLSDRTEPFRDDNCSATTVWGPRLAQYDPTPDEPQRIDVVNPGLGGGIPGETVARWAVIIFSLVVFLFAMTRGAND